MYIRDCKTKVCLSILFRIILKKEIKLNILNWPIKIKYNCIILNFRYVAQFPDFSVLR